MPSSSRNVGVERHRVAGSELEDVPDLDRDLEAERPTALGARVAFVRLADVGETRVVVSSGLDPEEMPAVAVRSGDVLTFAQSLVRDDLDLDPHGAERSAARAERRADLLVGRGTVVALERGEHLRLGEPVVAPYEPENERAVRLDDGHRLRRRCWRRCPSISARASIVVTPGVATSLGAAERVRERRGTGNAARDLEVGREVSVLARDERVLTRARLREEVDRLLAPIIPDSAWTAEYVRPRSPEDPVIRLLVLPEGDLEPRLVAVERVPVLHDELAKSEQPSARTRLVALLDREVVQKLRQLPVARDLPRVERHRLLVGHRQDVVAAVPILEAEDLRDRDRGPTAATARPGSAPA